MEAQEMMREARALGGGVCETIEALEEQGLRTLAVGCSPGAPQSALEDLQADLAELGGGWQCRVYRLERTNLRVTEAHARALTDAMGPRMLSPWDFGSAVIAAVKRAGWVEPVKIGGATRYRITELGRGALADYTQQRAR